MSTLREAAQALVDRWDTPLWKDALHTGQYIDALRAALAQPDESFCDTHCTWHNHHPDCALARFEAAHGIE